MSIWQNLDVLGKTEHILANVRPAVEGHHLGVPYLSAYQIAIAMQREYPEVAEALAVEVGGVGVGRHTSLAQYLARQLSEQIRRAGTEFLIEGAFLSNADVLTIQYRGPDGHPVTSSLVDAGWDAAIFRLRTAE